MVSAQAGNMYRTLQFRSSLPNEWVFDSGDNPISPGARQLAEAIVAELKKQLRVVTDLSQHSFYGWGFTTQYDRASFYHVLNPVEEVYLTVEYRQYWLHWLLRKHPRKRLDQYLSLLTDALKRIPGVSDLRPVLRMTKRSGPIARQGAAPQSRNAAPSANSGIREGPPSVG